MAKPLYVQAFEHFKDNNNDPLKAYVAFGLYVDAECKWAASQPTWPANAKYKEWHDCSVPYGTAAHNDKATDVLLEFANNIVEQERDEFLAAAIGAYKEEAAKSEKGFGRGVLEALTGAALWTIILIGAAFILRWFNPDIYEVLGRVLGKH
jgi:hypothetical protein